MDLEPYFRLLVVGSAFLLGLVWGSFVNVVAYRLPRRMSVVAPGSFCTSCGRHVRPLDNVPVLSFLLLGGRCRNCAAPISLRYPLVELASGGVVAAMAWRFGPTLEAGLLSALGLALVALFLTDLDFKTLPDEITIPGAVLGLVAGAAGQLGLLTRTQGAATFPESALGATAGVALLLGTMFLYQVIRGRVGMGIGDVKLMACIGAFLGAELMVASLLLAVTLGAVGGILFVAVKGGSLSTALPFGTYLAVATLGVVLLYGS